MKKAKVRLHKNLLKICLFKTRAALVRKVLQDKVFQSYYDSKKVYVTYYIENKYSTTK